MRGSIRLARMGIPTEYYLRHGWEKNAERFAKLRTLMDKTVHPLLIKEYDLTLERFISLGQRLDLDLAPE